MSEEHKRKIGLANSISLKGTIPWNKGVPCSEETKKKLSNKLKGRKISEENKKKVSQFFKGKSLSAEHRKKISIACKGRKAPRGCESYAWKGGKTRSSQGYLYINSPNHPHRLPNGTCAEHRLVCEKHLGRYLTSKERVHHINKITDDNRIENLMLFKSQGYHCAFHRFGYCSQQGIIFDGRNSTSHL